MPVHLTPEVLRASYDLLAATEPFCKWNLPEGEEIDFKVARDKTCYAWHDKRRGKRHFIAVSRHRVGSLETLLKTMGHEMVHLYTAHAGIRDTSDHGAAFKKLAEQVCRVHSFDPKEF